MDASSECVHLTNGIFMRISPQRSLLRELGKRTNRWVKQLHLSLYAQQTSVSKEHAILMQMLISAPADDLLADGGGMARLESPASHATALAASGRRKCASREPDQVLAGEALLTSLTRRDAGPFRGGKTNRIRTSGASGSR